MATRVEQLPKTQNEGSANPYQASIDKSLQSIANTNPEYADRLMDILGYGAPIPADVLNSRERIITPRPLAPSVQAAGLEGSLEAAQDAPKSRYVQDLEARASQASANKTDSLEALLEGLTSTSGKEELTDDAYSRGGGVDDLQGELDGINQEIREEQHSLRRKLEAIEKNPEGLFGGALRDKMEDTRTESLRKQADLSIIQMGVQGRYDSAKEIADRAVAIQFERQERRIQGLNLLYGEYKDLFNTAEQRAFEAAQKERQDKIDEEKTLQTDIYKLALDAQKNGAPSSIVRSVMQAKTREDAAAAVGQYGTDPLDRALKRAQLAKLTAPSIPDAPVLKEIDGVTMQWDGSKWIRPTGAGGGGEDEGVVLALQDKIGNINSLLDHAGLRDAVGTMAGINRSTPFSFSKATGTKMDFIAGVQQLVSQDTLNTLINLKKEGGTLGALSDGERIMLQSAASRIGTWSVKDKNDSVVGYNASEKDFKKELETIKTLTERALKEAGGDVVSGDSYLDTVEAALRSGINDYALYGPLLNQ